MLRTQNTLSLRYRRTYICWLQAERMKFTVTSGCQYLQTAMYPFICVKFQSCYLWYVDAKTPSHSLVIKSLSGISRKKEIIPTSLQYLAFHFIYGHILFYQSHDSSLTWRLTDSPSLSLSLSQASQPNVNQGRLILKVSRSHTMTHHSRYDSSGRVIGPSQRPLPDKTQHSQETDIHAPGGIRNSNPRKRGAADFRFRPLGLWDRGLRTTTSKFYYRHWHCNIDIRFARCANS
jgi:hypothetical protein